MPNPGHIVRLEKENDQLRADLATVTAERGAALRDTARLEWIAAHRGRLQQTFPDKKWWVDYSPDGQGATYNSTQPYDDPRAAIDAAMMDAPQATGGEQG